MKRILVALLLMFGAALPAKAQYTQSQITTIINTQLASGQGITAQTLRGVLLNMNTAIFQSIPPTGTPQAGWLPFATGGSASIWESPAAGGLVTGPGSTTAGHSTCWNNATGTLLSDCGIAGAAPASQTGTNVTYGSSNCGALVQRSNSGTVMVDTLPSAGPTKCIFYIQNADSSAALVIQPGAGATLNTSNSGAFQALAPGQTAVIQANGATYSILSAPTLFITPSGGTTFYVCASGGSDTNHGLTAAACWATRQHAWNWIQQNVNVVGSVVIQLQDGTYSDQFFQAAGSITGQGEAASVTFSGDCTTPANVIIAYAGLAWAADDQGMFGLRCMTLSTTANNTDLVVAQRAGSLIVLLANSINAVNSSITFAGGATTSYHLLAQQQGQIAISGNHTITGGGYAHWGASAQGLILVLGSVVITNSGTPAFSGGFVVSTGLGYVEAVGLTYAFGCSGPRYLVDSTSVIYTGGGGANYFCGSTSGSIQSVSNYQ